MTLLKRVRTTLFSDVNLKTIHRKEMFINSLVYTKEPLEVSLYPQSFAKNIRKNTQVKKKL